MSNPTDYPSSERSNPIDDAKNERKALIESTVQPLPGAKFVAPIDQAVLDIVAVLKEATQSWRTVAENAEAAIEQALYYLDHHAPGRAREVLALAHERKAVTGGITTNLAQS